MKNVKTNRIVDKLKKPFKACSGFVIFIAIWWFVCKIGLVKEFYLPSPQSVWARFIENMADGSLLLHTLASLKRLLKAYIIGCLAGMVIGMFMGIIPRVGRFFKPLITFFNSLSGITWVPLAIAWFGIGDSTITFLIINAVFFMLAFTTINGVQAVPKSYINAMRTMGAGKVKIVTQVLLPGALPQILTGLRVGAGFAWRSLVAAEMVAGTSGLGFLAFKANYDFQQPLLLSCILLVGVVAVIMDSLVLAPIERLTIRRWGVLSEGE